MNESMKLSHVSNVTTCVRILLVNNTLMIPVLEGEKKTICTNQHKNSCYVTKNVLLRKIVMQ